MDELLIGVGDLHGHVVALRKLLLSLQQRRRIFLDLGSLTLSPGVKMVFTGDYIDRGNKSLEIIEMLMKLKRSNPDNVLTLFGNHELLALAGLDNARDALGYDNSLAVYSFNAVHGGNGGLEFIREFGTTEKEALTKYLERMSREGDIGKWMRRLLPGALEKICGKEVLFVHGGVPERINDIHGLKNELYEIAEFTKTPTEKFGGSEEKYLANKLVNARSIFWDRTFPKMSDSDAVEVIKKLGVDYIVIGHTPNRNGIIRSYGDKIFNIDIGMSPKYGENDPGAIIFSDKGISTFYVKNGEKPVISFK